MDIIGSRPQAFQRWGRYGELCVTVCPVTRTADRLAWLVKDTGCQVSWLSGWSGLCASLASCNSSRLKAPQKRWAPKLPRNGMCCLCKIFFFLSRGLLREILRSTAVFWLAVNWRWTSCFSPVEYPIRVCRLSDIWFNAFNQ